ncbi:MAG TPA: hypothetical protein PKD96_03205 [Candidatus Absconditabacterales bacterium]|nr:hypothetical protein [Candidatus Absconditabacterales bacterium]HMT27286.1 hypothetical protein [Candidatus Absconditabacterales bacterium]
MKKLLVSLFAVMGTVLISGCSLLDKSSSSIDNNSGLNQQLSLLQEQISGLNSQIQELKTKNEELMSGNNNLLKRKYRLKKRNEAIKIDSTEINTGISAYVPANNTFINDKFNEILYTDNEYRFKIYTTKDCIKHIHIEKEEAQENIDLPMGYALYAKGDEYHYYRFGIFNRKKIPKSSDSLPGIGQLLTLDNDLILADSAQQYAPENLPNSCYHSNDFLHFEKF